ncbi:MAG: type I-E CRISPR-associated protein Cas5/CasD [Dermatophilus congolensis]|nr:type I-E CRISPR-associated protein Cas5/CasD [Dermatophilus congolensis]
MSVLLLRLAGPLQAWGDSSRFTRRHTRTEPTKSGVLGLLAAAQGRRRTDPIEDLVATRFGVRVDQPGCLVRDFQTAHRWNDGVSMPLSYRYYIADAVFVAAVEGNDALITGLADAVQSPAFPLYLGRRSCPPEGQVLLGVEHAPLEDALTTVEWQAAKWYRRRLSEGDVYLEAFVDAVGPSEGLPDVVRDVPQSWNPERREYSWREVTSLDPIPKPNPKGRRPRHPEGSGDSTSVGIVVADEPDFMAEAGGVPCT